MIKIYDAFSNFCDWLFIMYCILDWLVVFFLAEHFVCFFSMWEFLIGFCFGLIVCQSSEIFVQKLDVWVLSWTLLKF